MKIGMLFIFHYNTFELIYLKIVYFQIISGISYFVSVFWELFYCFSILGG